MRLRTFIYKIIQSIICHSTVDDDDDDDRTKGEDRKGEEKTK